MAKTQTDTPDTAAVLPAISEPETIAGAISWANDILWAAENINNGKMTRKKAGSLTRWSLWSFGRENMRELMVQMVPKALTILDRNQTPDGPSEIETAENLGIAELEELLDGAMAEFRGGR